MINPRHHRPLRLVASMQSKMQGYPGRPKRLPNQTLRSSSVKELFPPGQDGGRVNTYAITSERFLPSILSLGDSTQTGRFSLIGPLPWPWPPKTHLSDSCLPFLLFMQVISFILKLEFLVRCHLHRWNQPKVPKVGLEVRWHLNRSGTLLKVPR